MTESAKQQLQVFVEEMLADDRVKDLALLPVAYPTEENPEGEFITPGEVKLLVSLLTPDQANRLLDLLVPKDQRQSIEDYDGMTVDWMLFTNLIYAIEHTKIIDNMKGKLRQILAPEFHHLIGQPGSSNVPEYREATFEAHRQLKREVFVHTFLQNLREVLSGAGQGN